MFDAIHTKTESGILIGDRRQLGFFRTGVDEHVVDPRFSRFPQHARINRLSERNEEARVHERLIARFQAHCDPFFPAPDGWLVYILISLTIPLFFFSFSLISLVIRCIHNVY